MNNKLSLTLEPSYQHDCEHCIFLASVYLIGQIVDLWIACDKDEKYYIVRYSSEGSDYSTVLNYYPDNPVMGHKSNPSGKILTYNYEVLEFVEEKVKLYLSNLQKH